MLFLSFCIGMLSCNNYYRNLEKTDLPDSCLLRFRPDIERALYRTSVDIVGKHISGLLLIKTMPDSSIRIAFSNEAGFSFFDFGFLPNNGFKIYQIVPDLNKKAVVKTLRKDFELILFRNREQTGRFTLRDSTSIYYGYPQSKGVNYYVTDTNCSMLLKMQRASKRKPVMEAALFPGTTEVPDSISIRHLNFNFAINLKKI